MAPSEQSQPQAASADTRSRRQTIRRVRSPAWIEARRRRVAPRRVEVADERDEEALRVAPSTPPWSVSTFISLVTGRLSTRSWRGAGRGRLPGQPVIVGADVPGVRAAPRSPPSASRTTGGDRDGVHGRRTRRSRRARAGDRPVPGRTTPRRRPSAGPAGPVRGSPTSRLPGVISWTSGSAASRHASPRPWPRVISLSTVRCA